MDKLEIIKSINCRNYRGWVSRNYRKYYERLRGTIGKSADMMLEIMNQYAEDEKDKEKEIPTNRFDINGFTLEIQAAYSESDVTVPLDVLLKTKIESTLSKIDASILNVFILKESLTDENISQVEDALINVEFLQHLIEELEAIEDEVYNGEKVIWREEIIDLVTLFFDLKDNNFIDCEVKTLIDLISSRFCKKNGKPISKSYISKTLRPSSKKSKRRIDFTAWN